MYIWNSGLLEAKGCRCFVNRLTSKGVVLDPVRSQLAWKGRGILGGTFSPLDIRRGFHCGQYLDVCASDGLVTLLQVKSLRAKEGYPPYADPGTYTFDLSAEGSGVCDQATLRFTVAFDGKNWDSLIAVGAALPPQWKGAWPIHIFSSRGAATQ